MLFQSYTTLLVINILTFAKMPNRDIIHTAKAKRRIEKFDASKIAI